MHYSGGAFAVRRLIAQYSRPLGSAPAGLAGGPRDPGQELAAVQLFNPYLLRVENKGTLGRLALGDVGE